jgi:flavin-dependent dehydrogenase
VDAASEAGAEIREGFTVEEIVLEDGRVTGIRGRGADGRTVTEHARVVVGADGRHSLVARAVKPERYHEKPPLLCGYYTYWSGLPMDGRFETFVRPERGFAAWPTNDDLTVVIGGWPYAELEANRGDIEGNYLKMLELAPAFAERVHAATREARFVGTAVPNWFRRPYGPGWALVGDAGYNKDFITGHGIHDAFRDAELCAAALDQTFAGARPFEAAMGEYQSRRDRQVLPMYELTTQLATLEPPPPEWQQLMAAMLGNQDAMDGFARVLAGVTSPAEFFSEENAGRILAAAH